MALNVYRRHAKDCRFFSNGQNFTACNCPIWAYGYLNGSRVRKAVGVRDWARAVKRVETWEECPNEVTAPGVSVSECVKAYLADCASQHRAESTLASYRNTLGPLSAFCNSRGIVDIAALDLEALTAFRDWRNVASSTQLKDRGVLRTFCTFCVRRKWMGENFAAT
jgi:hypothetical protein